MVERGRLCFVVEDQLQHMVLFVIFDFCYFSTNKAALLALMLEVVAIRHCRISGPGSDLVQKYLVERNQQYSLAASASTAPATAAARSKGSSSSSSKGAGGSLGSSLPEPGKTGGGLAPTTSLADKGTAGAPGLSSSSAGAVPWSASRSAGIGGKKGAPAKSGPMPGMPGHGNPKTPNAPVGLAFLSGRGPSDRPPPGFEHYSYFSGQVGRQLFTFLLAGMCYTFSGVWLFLFVVWGEIKYQREVKREIKHR